MSGRRGIPKPNKKHLLKLSEIGTLRREAIIRLTRKHHITNINQLQKLLEQEGFFVTRPTIARDCQKANVIRSEIEPGSKKYAYIHVPWVSGDENLRDEMPQSLVLETLRSDLYYFHSTVYRVNNIIVVNCDAGGGYAIRRSLSSVNWPQMASVIGDYCTVWCLCNNLADAELVLARLQVMAAG